jgi:hypothetical protein
VKAKCPKCNRTTVREFPHHEIAKRTGGFAGIEPGRPGQGHHRDRLPALQPHPRPPHSDQRAAQLGFALIDMQTGELLGQAASKRAASLPVSSREQRLSVLGFRRQSLVPPSTENILNVNDFCGASLGNRLSLEEVFSWSRSHALDWRVSSPQTWHDARRVFSIGRDVGPAASSRWSRGLPR